MNLLRSLGVALLCAGSLTASAGVMLTADVYDTPGLAGYQTYDLTASASTGYLNGFDFTKSGLGGIAGPLHQGGVPSDDPWASYGADTLFGGLSGDAADSHWLVNSSDGFAVQSSQSSGDLGTAFVFGGASGLRDTHRSLPFARIVTDDPSAVSLNGEFLVEQFYSDGGGAGQQLFDVSTLLSDVGTGAAPEYTTFPDRPRPVFERPVVTPPIVETPTVTPPVLPEPPLVEPPVVDPIEPVEPPIESPVYEPPVVTVEDYQSQLTDRQAELQSQIDALKSEQNKVGVLLAESEEPGFVPPSNVITIQPYPTRRPVYTTYPWLGSVATIDVALGAPIQTERLGIETIDLSGFVLNRGLVAETFTITNAAYDGDASSSLALNLNVASAFEVIPEPATALLALLAACGVRGVRNRE